MPQDQRLAAGTLSSLPGLLSSHARKETQSLCTRVSLIDAYTYARVTYTYILSTTFDHWLQSILPRLYRSNALVLAAHVSCCCCCSALAICVTLVKESCDSQPRRKQTAARCVREHTESGAKNALDYSTRDDKLSLARSLSLSPLLAAGRREEKRGLKEEESSRKCERYSPGEPVKTWFPLFAP